MNPPRISDLIRLWVFGHRDRAARLEPLFDGPQGTTARGVFLGQNNSDPAATGELIFTQPQNLPTATATLLSHAQVQADFHPASANPADLLAGFLRYLQEIRTGPFAEILNDEIPQFFDSGNFAVLVAQIAQTYIGVSRDDQLALAQSIADMNRSVMSSEHAELWANLFTQTTIDYSQPDETKVYLYFTTLHMKHEVDHSGKSESVTSEQSFVVRRAIYRILPDVLRAHAAEFAQLTRRNVDDWLQMATTPERPGAPQLCFPVRLLDA